MPSTSRPSARRVAGRWVAGVLAALLLIFLAGAVWVGIRATEAIDHVERAQEIAGDMGGSLAADPAALADTVDDIAAETSRARELTADPVWRAYGALPWIGPQLGAVTTLTDALDTAVSGAVAPLATTFADVTGGLFSPDGGAIDLAPLAGSAETARTANAEAQRAAAAVAAIDTAPLVKPLREATAEAGEQLDRVADVTEALENATSLLPSMLGSDGPRDYLLLAQNNAEWRSLGGIAGNVIHLTADAGRLEIADQVAGGSFGRVTSAADVATGELRAIFGDDPESYMQNVTQVPDFAVSAQLATAMWQAEHGGEVDGVIALDPVALSYLVGAVGGVELPTGGTATEETLVPMLLSDLYAQITVPAEQDAAFGAVTAAVFDAVMSGSGEPAAMIEALARAGSERRVLVWSAHADEQTVLAETTLAGGLPETDTETTGVGVYLNDGTGSKMDYFMEAAAGAAWCSATDQARLSVGVELTSTAPADAATVLPDYVLGSAAGTETIGGVEAGMTRTVAYVYLPEGSSPGDIEARAGDASILGTHEGRSVVAWTTVLAPGETARLEVATTARRTGAIDIVSTPTVHPGEISRLDSPCGSPE
ncbi:DUF4012 domain-containing protein [Microbacterium excoecariae]|uniref:DUF4012 domain-containing protein n=1 Tax=Microbacterium excoecariae TaxID=2715210 RepID=UPI00140BE62E|nr:DUF4012 domain-containing protein [Microbacterium excoecariae]